MIILHLMLKLLVLEDQDFQQKKSLGEKSFCSPLKQNQNINSFNAKCQHDSQLNPQKLTTITD